MNHYGNILYHSGGLELYSPKDIQYSKMMVDKGTIFL